MIERKQQCDLLKECWIIPPSALRFSGNKFSGWMEKEKKRNWRNITLCSAPACQKKNISWGKQYRVCTFMLDWQCKKDLFPLCNTMTLIGLKTKNFSFVQCLIPWNIFLGYGSICSIIFLRITHNSVPAITRRCKIGCLINFKLLVSFF